MPSSMEILNKTIEEAFADVQYPGDDRIAKCSREVCQECEGVRQDFRGQTLGTLQSETLEKHFDSLPLFLPEAFHYYIQAYMRYATGHVDSLVTRFTEYSLAPVDFDDFWRQRFRLFTPRQRQAVITFLEVLKAQKFEGDDEDNVHYRGHIDIFIEVWKSLD